MSYRLYIAHNGDCVATLDFDPKSEAFTLEYRSSWQRHGFALSPNLPLDGRFSCDDLTRFIRDLLPDAGNNQALIRLLKLRSGQLYPQLRALGEDLLGAFRFVEHEEDCLIQPQTWQALDQSGLVQRIAQRQRIPISIWMNRSYATLPGSGQKLTLIKDAQEQLCLSNDRQLSTHIMSFARESQAFRPLNIFLCCALANALSIPVVTHDLLRYARHSALLSPRIDRKLSADGRRVLRRHVISAHQFRDYSDADNPDIKDLQRAYQSTASGHTPVMAKHHLLQGLLFCILCQHYDNRTDHLAFYSDHQGYHLAPFLFFYCHGIETSEAFEIPLGGCKISPKLNQGHLVKLAKQFDVDKKYLFHRLAEQAKALLGLCHIEGLMDLLPNGYDLFPEEEAFVARLSQILRHNAALSLSLCETKKPNSDISTIP